MADHDSIMALPYAINNLLRYSTSPDLRLTQHSTREDVRRVRHLLPQVRGIGTVALADIDAWLGADPKTETPERLAE